MISIIVSSYKEHYYQQFEKNVRETVGVPYEIVRINNPGLMGICEAYNRGAQQARYDLLCYAHEDIEILTADWGKIVEDIFRTNLSLGLVGIAGNQYKPFAPSGWNALHTEKYQYYQLIQEYSYAKNPVEHHLRNPTNEKLAKVVCVDGVWFCTKKQIVLENPFDEKTFKNFHCYDIDFSLSLFGKYEVGVTFDVLLRHFSEGNYGDKKWMEDTLKLYKKWRLKAPLSSAPVTKAERDLVELSCLHAFIITLKNSGYTFRQIHNNLVSGSLFLKLSILNILKTYKLILLYSRAI